MNKNQMTRLVKALRSGNFKQGFGELYTPKKRAHCCLGVACYVGRIRNRDMKGLDLLYSGEVLAKTGFSRFNGGRTDLNKLVIGGREYNSLAHANDAGVSFNKIADYIESNYQAL